jgi:hypothetical protein
LLLIKLRRFLRNEISRFCGIFVLSLWTKSSNGDHASNAIGIMRNKIVVVTVVVLFSTVITLSLLGASAPRTDLVRGRIPVGVQAAGFGATTVTLAPISADSDTSSLIARTNTYGEFEITAVPQGVYRLYYKFGNRSIPGPIVAALGCGAKLGPFTFAPLDPDSLIAAK